MLSRNDFCTQYANHQIAAKHVVLATDTLEAKFWELTEPLRADRLTVLKMNKFCG